jgi:hypothetical protein
LSKKSETIALEDWLFERLNPAGKGRVSIYGAAEVTLSVDASANKLAYGGKKAGYQGRVDFISIDTKRVIRAYEIKVSLADFRSSAKKSWVGDYNYLVTTAELAETATSEIIAELPPEVGWITPEGIVKRPKRVAAKIDTNWLVWLMMRRNAMVVRQYRTGH